MSLLVYGTAVAAFTLTASAIAYAVGYTFGREDERSSQQQAEHAARIERWQQEGREREREISAQVAHWRQIEDDLNLKSAARQRAFRREGRN